MTLFGGIFDSGRGLLDEAFGVSVTYVHKARSSPTALAESSQTYTVLARRSSDVGGGSRQLQQPKVFDVRTADVVRAPQRGDTITHSGATYTVVDVAEAEGAAAYRLTAQYAQKEG